MDDDIYVAGGVEIPDHMLCHDMIQFENAPDDDQSRLLLQLISLHLRKWTDEQKCQIITAIHTMMGITPLNSTIINPEWSASNPDDTAK